MLAGIQAKLILVALLVVLGAAGGAIGMAKLDGARVARLTGDLADARRAAVSERAAREAIAAQCAAGDVAASRAADLNDAAQRAIQRANQELDNAILDGATRDDADPLRAQFNRLRGQGAAGAGAGGDPAAPARGADPLPGRP